MGGKRLAKKLTREAAIDALEHHLANSKYHGDLSDERIDWYLRNAQTEEWEEEWEVEQKTEQHKDKPTLTAGPQAQPPPRQLRSPQRPAAAGGASSTSAPVAADVAPAEPKAAGGAAPVAAAVAPAEPAAVDATRARSATASADEADKKKAKKHHRADTAEALQTVTAAMDQLVKAQKEQGEAQIQAMTAAMTQAIQARGGGAGSVVPAGGGGGSSSSELISLFSPGGSSSSSGVVMTTGMLMEIQDHVARAEACARQAARVAQAAQSAFTSEADNLATCLRAIRDLASRRS